MDCSPGSPVSPGSSQLLEHTSEDPSWVKPANEGMYSLYTQMSAVSTY